MPKGSASMPRLLAALPLAAGLLSCGGSPKAFDAGTDYTLNLRPNVVAVPPVAGRGARGIATVTWLDCAPQTVDLTLANAPAGVISTFLPPSTSTTSVFNVALGPTPPPAGYYHMQIQGVAADVHHAQELDLAVQDFTLAQPPPASGVIPGTVNVPISFTREPAELPYTGTVTLTAFTPATYILAPPPTVVANPGASATLSFGIPAGAVGGTYPITVTGTDAANGLTHQVTFNLTIN